MGKRIAFCLLLVLSYRYTDAQISDSLFDADEGYRRPAPVHYFKFGVTGVFAKYIQSDLSEINQNIHDNLSFETGLTDNFPANFYAGTYLLFRINRGIYLGPDYRFQTTGSRLAYRDYSGSYTFDQIISAHSVAIRIEGTPGKEQNPQFCLSACFGINISSWRISEALAVGDVHESSANRFDALIPFIYPAIKLRFKANSLISIVPSIGYSFDLPGKYHLHGSKDAKTDYVANWKGPRGELSIDLSF